MKPKFKVGDEVILQSNQKDAYHAVIESTNPKHDSPNLGAAYNTVEYGIWNEKYIRKLTKLDKILK